jgi:hypothetical protein
MTDLYEVWYDAPALKAVIVSKCHRLFETFGVDEEGFENGGEVIICDWWQAWMHKAFGPAESNRRIYWWLARIIGGD